MGSKMGSKTDDRYRIRQDRFAISEALWQVAKDYGIHNEIDSDEQVALARSLEDTLKSRSGPLTAGDVKAAFQKFELPKPPRGYATAVCERLERLDR